MTLDVARIRKDFPILDRQVYGKPLVYLDNAATSQKPRQVIDALVRYYENTNANIHRAVHCLGEEATTAYEDAREKVAGFINAPSRGMHNLHPQHHRSHQPRLLHLGPAEHP